jgi:hypothetical protein
VQTVLNTALLELLAIPGGNLTLGDLGLTVLMIRRQTRPPWRKHLYRAVRVRHAHVPQSSRILWTKGKGTVGRCWKEEKLVAKDTKTLYGQYLTGSEADWNGAPDHVRMNLSFEEFQRIRELYSEVVAVPIFDKKGQFRGCAVVDTRYDAPGSLLVGKQAVYSIMHKAATTIGNYLSYCGRLVHNVVAAT